MPRGKAIEWPEPAEVQRLLDELGSQDAVALYFGGISQGAVSRFCQRHGLRVHPKPGASDNDDGSRNVLSDLGETPSPEELLEKYSMDPEEWYIVRARVNFWGDPPQPQLRVDVIPREQAIVPVDPAGYQAPKPRKRRATNAKPLKAEVIEDHHAPYHEPTFHALYLEYLADEQPDLIDVNGDLGDYPTPSRHRHNDKFSASVQECLDASHGILRDYREVCPDARIRLKKGNHEERLEHLIVDNARALHRISPAQEEVPALDLQRLLRLDELAVEYVPEPWDQAKTKLSQKLTARHGISTSPSAGKVMLDKLAGSTIQGHDHCLALALRTEHGVDGDLEIRMAMSGGCACIIPGGLGYVAGGEPNWQNGCVHVDVWPDGDFHATPGVYVPGRFLAPNGKRYKA